MDAFTQTEPREGAAPSARTVVRVLASRRAIIIGIVCEDATPDRIVTFSVRRDAPLNAEDHVRVAAKRRSSTQVTWWFGGFYDGDLDQIEWTAAWNPAALVTVELSGERNIGRLSAGRFTQTLVGGGVRLNLSSDLSIASYTQYDTDSDSIGVNTRLRWTFNTVGDLFVVYNHNVRSLVERWQLDSSQLLVKFQYAWRM
jgi:hypothetical protein